MIQNSLVPGRQNGMLRSTFRSDQDVFGFDLLRNLLLKTLRSLGKPTSKGDKKTSQGCVGLTSSVVSQIQARTFYTDPRNKSFIQVR